QEQTRDILKTVREGFFLLDAEYRIGSVWSEALTRMFGRGDFAGLFFEELLKELVPPATLNTAMKYIKLLWGDRAHENLMKSINPLGQLEMMLGMMHVDPLQLTTFLDSTETGLQLINAILKEPARTDGEFRKKLNGLFRELHSIKGEASALNLMSIAHRVHSLEDMVSELKKKAELSGNDFLPMVLKLDDLLAHLRSVREMATRLTVIKDAPAPAKSESKAPAPQAAPAAAGSRSPDDMSPTLHAMA